jgi:hypothetical protein
VITFKPGQVWRTRGGETCTIVLMQDPTTSDYPIHSDLYGGHWHRPNGTSCLANEGTDYEDDLIEPLSDPD